MRYCSYEARRVVDCLGEYGIELKDSEYIRLEQIVGSYYQTHVQGVITRVLKPSTMDAASKAGWLYFEKPILSMLAPRIVAHRPDRIIFEISEHVEQIYNTVVGFCVADFNMKELALIVGEFPTLCPDISTLALCIDAAKRMNNRSVFYLHGIARREHATRAGKIAELQAQLNEGADLGWSPDTEPMDYVDSRLLRDRWKDRQADLKISQALTDAQA